MAHKFNKGDLVTVLTKNSIYEGARGRVERSQDDDTYLITMETGKISGFFERELEIVDEDREALIRLAETLDLARQQANASGNPEVASQRGVYGTVALALIRTLEELVGAGMEATRNATASRVYESVLDGNSVREALKLWETER